MPDSFTSTETVGYGSRILGSINKIGLGIILFLASFIVLYWNEGRVNFANIAKNAIVIDSSAVSPDNEGKLVSTTGTVTTTDKIGDSLFLKPNSYLQLVRKVEMYAWVEQKHQTSTKNVGGSETVTTTYDYAKEWTTFPKGNFVHPEGHSNPPLSIAGTTVKAATAKMGAYTLVPTSLSLPPATAITPSADQLNLPKGVVLDSGYVFKGKGSVTSPEVGDVRVQYEVVDNNFSGLVMGKVQGSSIVPFVDKDGSSLYRLFSASSKEEAVSNLNTEYSSSLWFIRFVGFMLMWVGLTCIFGVISVIADFLPIFGSISRLLINCILLIVAIVLTGVTIIVADIFHSLLAISIIVTALVACIIFFGVKAKNKAAAMKAGVATSVSAVASSMSSVAPAPQPVTPSAPTASSPTQAPKV